MTERVYSVVLQIKESKLPTVLGAIAGSAALVSVTPTEEPAPPEQAKRVLESHYYAGGKRNKGISGEDLALKVLKESPNHICRLDTFRKAFIAHGFAETSPSPVLSRLVAEKRIRNLGDGRYCLPGTTITLGAAAAQSGM